VLTDVLEPRAVAVCLARATFAFGQCTKVIERVRLLCVLGRSQAMFLRDKTLMESHLDGWEFAVEAWIHERQGRLATGSRPVLRHVADLLSEGRVCARAQLARRAAAVVPSA
jgi:hypothetical protein